jgi:hypothetical protein
MACVYGLVLETAPEAIRYVGVTKYNTVDRRWYSHKIRRDNGHQLPVYDWMRKHGDAVIPVVIGTCASWDDAVALEITTIAAFRTAGADLLNCTSGGEGITNMSEESLEKLRQKATGRKHSEDAKRKMSAAKKGQVPHNKGKQASEETRRKLSEARKGVSNHTEESRRKIAMASTGRTHTEESKRKIGDAHRGKTVSEETRQKLSGSLKGRVPPNRGKKMSEEQRRKLSEARKGKAPWNKGLRKASASE